MSDRWIAVVRWALLTVAALNLLQATLLWAPSRCWLLQPWLASVERAGGTLPPLLRDERVLRAVGLLVAALLFAAWWYFGTPAGEARLREAAQELSPRNL